MASLVALRSTGRGRQPVAAEEARTATEELDKHCEEAIAFVDACVPLLDAIVRVAEQFDARLLHVVRQLERRHYLYQLRHLPRGDEPDEMAVAA